MASKKYKFRKQTTYKGVTFVVRADSQEDYDRKFIQKIHDIDQRVLRKSGKITLNAWSDLYFERFVRENVSDSTFRDRKSVYKNRIAPFIGAMPVRDVSAMQCQNVINELSGLSKDSVDRTCQLLFNLFKSAVNEQMIAHNPAADLIRPAAVNGQGRAMTMNERALLLLAADNHRAELWIWTMLFLGFRPGETDRFQGKHLNLDAGVVYVPGTKSAAAIRIVPVPSFLLARFRELSPKKNDYIFTSQRGTPFQTSSRMKAWRSVVRQMNILAGSSVYRNKITDPRVRSDFLPYCCRHTFATDLKDAGVPYRIRQELLGHADTSVTDRYTHRSEASLWQAADLLSTYYDGMFDEVRRIQEGIRMHGYDSRTDHAGDITRKFFPDLVD